MVRPRCPECGRLTIGVEVTVSSVDGLKTHALTLLKLAREFDDNTPEGEHYTAVDFVDSLALGWGGPKYDRPASKAWRKGPSKAA